WNPTTVPSVPIVRAPPCTVPNTLVVIPAGHASRPQYRFTTAAGAMIAAAVAPSAERVAAARGQIDAGRKERVRQAVLRHLRTPTLGPTNLCRVVGMSRSNLYTRIGA